MASAYTLIYKTPAGTPIAQFGAFSRAQLSLGVNRVGALTLTQPYDLYPFYFYQPDYILEVWRAVGSNLPYLVGNTAFLVRAITKDIKPGGEKSVTLVAQDVKDILARRIVAYLDGSSQALKSSVAADNAIKAVVNENAGSGATDTARQISGLTVDPDATLAPVITKAFGHQNVLKVLQEMAQASYQAGTYLAFELVYDPASTPVSLRLATMTGQYGLDRRWPSGAAGPVLLTPEQGAVAEASLTFDWRGMANVVYAGASGGPNQVVPTPQQDAASLALSPFIRSEAWLSVSDATTVTNEAQAALRNLRALKTYTCRVLDTPALKLGVHYNFGDFISTLLDTEQLDARLDTLLITLENGGEQVNTVLRADA